MQHRLSNSDGSSEGFYSARTHVSEQNSVPIDGSSCADSTTPLLRTSRTKELSHILTEEENRLMNGKIDRLVAVLLAGRQLHFSPDSQTGNVDVSIARDKSDYAAVRTPVKGGTIASIEFSGSITRSGGGRRRLSSPSSALLDSTNASEVRSTSLSSAWENVLAMLEELEQLYTPEQESEARFLPPIRADNPTEILATVVRDGQYITYIDKGDVKVATVAPIPLDLTKPLRISTPSTHSTGNDLDCSSPLYEKSLQALIRETRRDVASSKEATHDSRDSDIRDSVFDWLEHVKTPPLLEELTNVAGKRQDLHIFRDGGKHELPPKGDRSYLTASRALKDVSNLRRPGYLQHNSFAQTIQVNKPKADTARPAPLKPERQPYRGADDAESSCSSIEAKWAISISNLNSRKLVRASKLPSTPKDSTYNPPPTPRHRRRHKYPSPQKNPTLQSPTRTSHFDLALARLEGRAGVPQQYSPIQRYADETGVYAPDVLNESRPLERRHPVPMLLSPFGESVVGRLEREVAEVIDGDGGGRG